MRQCLHHPKFEASIAFTPKSKLTLCLFRYKIFYGKYFSIFKYFFAYKNLVNLENIFSLAENLWDFIKK